MIYFDNLRIWSNHVIRRWCWTFLLEGCALWLRLWHFLWAGLMLGCGLWGELGEPQVQQCVFVGAWAPPRRVRSCSCLRERGVLSQRWCHHRALNVPLLTAKIIWFECDTHRYIALEHKNTVRLFFDYFIFIFVVEMVPLWRARLGGSGW